MCVDGPEDRGSIANYGSPERMSVLSRKERTLPMRKLPAAFAVFRIQPPAEFSACRQLILTGEHLVADVCLHLKVPLLLQNVVRSAPNRGSDSIILFEVGRLFRC